MSANLTSRNTWFLRYSAAVAAACAGLLVRMALTSLAGEGLPTYITFYPAVMIVALLGGFGPGLVATVASALLASYYLLPPLGHFAIEHVVDAVGLAFFLGMGLFISVVAALYRRARERVAAYEAQAPPWERRELPPRPWVERLLINGGMILSLAILAAAGWASNRTADLMVQADRWVTHNYAVHEDTEQALLALQEMEAGVQGYLLTGREDYLDSTPPRCLNSPKNWASSSKRRWTTQHRRSG